MPSLSEMTHDLHRLLSGPPGLGPAAHDLRAWQSRLRTAGGRLPWSSPAARSFDVSLTGLLGQLGRLADSVDETVLAGREHSMRASHRAAEVRRLSEAALHTGERWVGLR